MTPLSSEESPFYEPQPNKGHAHWQRLLRRVQSIPDHILILCGIVLLPFLFLLLLIGFYKLLPITGYNIAVRAESYQVTPTPFQPRQLTPTPFQPLGHPTAAFSPHAFQEPTPTPAAPPFLFHGLNFEPGQSRITLNIFPPDDRVNQGQAIRMSFLPGETCMFSDGYGCIHTFQNQAGGRIIFITLHSGVGGEAESFRHAVEGTSLGRAGFSLTKTLTNLNALIGAKASIVQSGLEDHTLALLWASRLPASLVEPYYGRPVREALTFAAQHDPSLEIIETTTKTLIVFETCGWRILEEEWPVGQPETSGAVYIGVIGISQPGE
jgi:hypothetical protein